MTAIQLVDWLQRHGYVRASKYRYEDGSTVRGFVNLKSGAIVWLVDSASDGSSKLLEDDGTDVTWIAELKGIPEQSRHVRSLRHAHYLKYGRTA